MQFADDQSRLASILFGAQTVFDTLDGVSIASVTVATTIRSVMVYVSGTSVRRDLYSGGVSAKGGIGHPPGGPAEGNIGQPIPRCGDGTDGPRRPHWNSLVMVVIPAGQAVTVAVIGNRTVTVGWMHRVFVMVLTGMVNIET